MLWYGVVRTSAGKVIVKLRGYDVVKFAKLVFDTVRRVDNLWVQQAWNYEYSNFEIEISRIDMNNDSPFS